MVWLPFHMRAHVCLTRSHALVRVNDVSAAMPRRSGRRRERGAEAKSSFPLSLLLPSLEIRSGPIPSFFSPILLAPLSFDSRCKGKERGNMVKSKDFSWSLIHIYRSCKRNMQKVIMLNYNESNFPSPDEARAVQTSPAPNNFLSPVLLNEEGM